MIFLGVALLFVSCHDNVTNPLNDIDVGTAADYFSLKSGNWWSYSVSSMPSNQVLYTFQKYQLRRTIGDSLRHQNGNLLFQFADQYDARISYGIVYWYAVTDAGIFLYYGIQDSVYANGQWISTITSKIPILMNPILIGHSWTAVLSDSVETYKIASISQQTIGGIVRPLIGVAHFTSTKIDTSWYAKDYGLIYNHEYTMRIIPPQGSNTVLDSCYVQ